MTRIHGVSKPVAAFTSSLPNAHFCVTTEILLVTDHLSPLPALSSGNPAELFIASIIYCRLSRAIDVRVNPIDCDPAPYSTLEMITPQKCHPWSNTFSAACSRRKWPQVAENCQNSMEEWRNRLEIHRIIWKIERETGRKFNQKAAKIFLKTGTKKKKIPHEN